MPFSFLSNRLACATGIAIVFAVGFPAKKAYAWGFVGHQIVCEVAFEHLDREFQIEVNRLVRSFAKPNGKRFTDFRKSCSFADTARHNARDGFKRWRHYQKFDRWHYLNVPRTTEKLSEPGIQCANNCVLDAIRFHSDKISDLSLPDAERGEALIFLAHWIADIHQPLHVGFADDHGGSDIEVTPLKRFGRNLHSAWDSGLLKKARGKRKLRQYTADIGKISNADEAAWVSVQEPLQWAAESYYLATAEQAGYCQWKVSPIQASDGKKSGKACSVPQAPVRIDQLYLSQNTPVLEKRLQQAAVRLAEHLETLLNRSMP